MDLFDLLKKRRRCESRYDQEQKKRRVEASLSVVSHTASSSSVASSGVSHGAAAAAASQLAQIVSGGTSDSEAKTNKRSRVSWYDTSGKRHRTLRLKEVIPRVACTKLARLSKECNAKTPNIKLLPLR